MTATSLRLFDLVPDKVLVGRYKIVRPHRQGGMAATFEVEDQENGERRELQAFPSSLFEDRDQTVEFAERLALWKDLSVPAVLRVTDVLVLDDGALLYVCDFPPGDSLRSWMSENPRMEPADVAKLGCTLLAGLKAIHAVDLIHGDVKPATVYYDSGERAGTLVDGGVTPGLWAAKHLGTRTALIGTPFYAPLEQFTGDSPDELSDLYNVATVLYELLTGVLPWTGRSFVEVFQSKMQKEPPAMSTRAPGVEVPRDLEQAIAGGLHAVRGERYATASDFLEKLSAVELS